MISPEPWRWVGERHPLSPRTWGRIAVALSSATLIGIVGVAAIVLFGADLDRPTVLVPRSSDRPYGSAEASEIDLLTPTTIVGGGCPER